MRYVVLGMHKSGTTLIAQTMHESGIDMGSFDPSSTYDQGNHHEREETLRLNKRLLDCGDAHSVTVVEAVSREDAPASLIGEMRETVRKLDAQHENWGFKDPRNCLTLEVWSSVLPEYKVVGVYRHPREVWNRYVHSKSPLARLGRALRGWRALKAWHVYNASLRACHDDPDTELLLLEYGRFMRQEESLAALGRFLGIEVLDIRKPELHRTSQEATLLYQIARFLQATLFSRDVEELYRDLERRGSSSRKSSQTTEEPQPPMPTRPQPGSKDTRSDSSQR